MGGPARRLALVAAACLTVALVAGCRVEPPGGPAGSGGGPVKVGLLVPKSGVYTRSGEDMKRGFQLYLDANGGMLGGREVEAGHRRRGRRARKPACPRPSGCSPGQGGRLVGIVNSAVALGVRDLFIEARCR